MAKYEARGFVKRIETKTSGSGGQRVQFDLAVAQKVRKDGVDVKDTLYVRCVDFKCENVPVEGEYVGVNGYLTITSWAKNGKNGVNADLNVQSYEKLPQKEGQPKLAPAANQAPPPADPWSL